MKKLILLIVCLSFTLGISASALSQTAFTDNTYQTQETETSFSLSDFFSYDNSGSDSHSNASLQKILFAFLAIWCAMLFLNCDSKPELNTQQNQ